MPVCPSRYPCGERCEGGYSYHKRKWQHYVPGDYTALTAGYLAVMYPAVPDEALFIAGNVCPDSGLAAAIGSLVSGEALVGADGGVLAF